MDKSDLKVQFWNVNHMSEPDDPEFPFKMQMLCHHLEGKEQRTLIFGPYEEMIVQAKSVDALWVSLHESQTLKNPRLHSVVIRDSAGTELYRYSAPSTS